MTHAWCTCGTELGTQGSGLSPGHPCGSRLPEGGQEIGGQAFTPRAARSQLLPCPNLEMNSPGRSGVGFPLGLTLLLELMTCQLTIWLEAPYSTEIPIFRVPLTMTSPLRRRAGSRLMQSGWGPGPAMRLWAERRQNGQRHSGRAQRWLCRVRPWGVLKPPWLESEAEAWGGWGTDK